MADIGQLQELQKESGKRLPVALILGFTHFARSALSIEMTVSNGRTAAKRSSAVGVPRALRAETKLKVLGAEPGDYLATQLNDALLGGADYPILGAVAGTAVGFGTGGAGFIFTAATTALSVAKTTRRVLARDGDQIWRVEEIGKVTSGGRVQPTYVLAYFLVDPLRGHSPHHKGWLVHEDRYDLLG
jgi:hypothetical protein